MLNHFTQNLGEGEVMLSNASFFRFHVKAWCVSESGKPLAFPSCESAFNSSDFLLFRYREVTDSAKGEWTSRFCLWCYSLCWPRETLGGSGPNAPWLWRGGTKDMRGAITGKETTSLAWLSPQQNLCFSHYNLMELVTFLLLRKSRGTMELHSLHLHF